MRRIVLNSSSSLILTILVSFSWFAIAGTKCNEGVTSADLNNASGFVSETLIEQVPSEQLKTEEFLGVPGLSQIASATTNALIDTNYILRNLDTSRNQIKTQMYYQNLSQLEQRATESYFFVAPSVYGLEESEKRAGNKTCVGRKLKQALLLQLNRVADRGLRFKQMDKIQLALDGIKD